MSARARKERLNMTQTKDTIMISDRDKKMIRLVTRLSDKEIFGIECFLAGIRAGASDAEKKKADQQQTAQSVAV